MPTPELVQSTRYANFDITKCLYIPAIASASLTPTRAEMTAGKDLSGEIADISGWVVSGNDIAAPDLKSTFVGQVAGRTTAENSSLSCYASENGIDVRDVLPRGTVGFIAWLDGGDVPGQPMDVFPIRVRSVGKTRSTGDEVAKVMVGCTITRTPAEDVVIPAAI